MRHIVLLFIPFICTFTQAQDLANADAGDQVKELFEQGERAYRSGAHQEAVQYYSRVLALDADHLNAYLQRGFCNSILKDYKAAVKDFSAVIQRKSDHLWAYTSRGSAYNKLGRHAEAMSDFDRVIALDPRNEEAYNNRGWAKKAMGDAKGACKDWKESKKMGNAEAKIILSNNHCK